MVVRVKAAVAFFANLTDGLSLAGRFAAGAVDRLYGVAGAVAAVGAVAVGRPVTVVLMSIALSLEHRQGLTCCSHILAAVPWRIVAVSLEQRQHRAVGKFCGGFGLCFFSVAKTIVSANSVQVRTGKIVAVFYSARITANNFATTIAARDSSNIVAIRDCAIVIPRNAAASFDSIAVTNCTNIITVDDCRTVVVNASNTATISVTTAKNAAIVAAIFNRSI